MITRGNRVSGTLTLTANDIIKLAGKRGVRPCRAGLKHYRAMFGGSRKYKLDPERVRRFFEDHETRHHTMWMFGVCCGADTLLNTQHAHLNQIFIEFRAQLNIIYVRYPKSWPSARRTDAHKGRIAELEEAYWVARFKLLCDRMPHIIETLHAS